MSANVLLSSALILSAVHLERLEFPEFLPPVTLLPSLPPSVRHLHVVTRSQGRGWLDTLRWFKAVDSLPGNMSLKAIDVVFADVPQFSWKRVNLGGPEFAAQIVPAALNLAQKGVLLLDTEGKGLQLVDEK